MCLKDLLMTLRGEGLVISETKIRWAISAGKVSRPPLDGSLRFNFGQEHLEQLRRLFGVRAQEAEKC